MRAFKRAIGRVVLFLFSRLTRVLSWEERVRVHLKEIEKAVDKERQLRIYRDETARLIESEEQVLIPTLEKGYGPEKDRFYTYQQRYVPFDIKAGEKVLDIGSGAYPFPYATHLADLYEEGTTHRAEPLVKTDLPFRTCDIERLPYKDKEFDFVYCSHVLEHVKDPARACEELMRVGARGYIETPTRLSDIMLNFIRLKEHHRWHVNLLGNTLVFMEWADKERRDTGINDFFVMLHSKYKNAFQDLVSSHRDLFVNMLLWQTGFHYYVLDKRGVLIATNKR
jgi:SAM-dependent methyltransferase